MYDSVIHQQVMRTAVEAVPMWIATLVGNSVGEQEEEGVHNDSRTCNHYERIGTTCPSGDAVYAAGRKISVENYLG